MAVRLSECIASSSSGKLKATALHDYMMADDPQHLVTHFFSSPNSVVRHSLDPFLVARN